MADEPLTPWFAAPPRAAYIHIPFCAHHCGYCDFAVVTGRDHEIDLYLEALAEEMKPANTSPVVDTIYLGGGTPTHLGANQLERLLSTVRHCLHLEAGGEFSAEANPRTLDADKIQVLADHGVNRISLGAQSFHPELLRVLERDHDPDDVPRAVDQVRQHIDNISLDVIFAVPGQTTAAWQNDLRRALALQPTHFSTYGLTFERGTRLWKQQRRGLVQALEEEAELAMYLMAIDTLASRGFEHYEISSFARAGWRCRHNQIYWANAGYFGFGMGAARFVCGRRELNTRSFPDYVRRVLAGESPTMQSEMLPPFERAVETIGVQMRRVDGIARQAFLEQTGFTLEEVAGPALTQFVELELLEDDGATVRLTRRGKCVADALITEIVARVTHNVVQPS